MSKLYKLIPVLIIFLILGNQLLTSEENSGKVVTKKRALEKSLLFPGWGQIHEKQFLIGGLFITAEVIAIAGIVINNNKGNDSYKKYRIAESESNAILWREETEKFDKRRNLFIFAGACIWIANMVEIYIFKNKRKKKGIKISLGKGTNNEVFFNLSYGF